jgi:hypothetical protein
MSPTEVITPSTITTDTPTDQEPETAYNWARQTRREEVTVVSLAKQQEGLRARRAKKSKATKSKSKRK